MPAQGLVDFFRRHSVLASDRGAAFAAEEDGRFRVLVDHGAAVWAPAKPHFDLSRLHHHRGFPVKGSERLVKEGSGSGEWFRLRRLSQYQHAAD